VEAESTSIASANNPANSIAISATRNWSDPSFNPSMLTRDYVPDCNLFNPATNGGCGPLSSSTFGTPVITTHYAPDVLMGWSVRPAVWQGSLSIQQELRPGVGLLVGYYRTAYENIRVTQNTAVPSSAYNPYTVTLPVDPRLPGGGGNQISGLYDVQPAFFGMTSNLVTQASNFGSPTQVYNGFDINLSARLRNSLVLSGGVSDGQTVTSNCYIVNSPQDLRFCQVTLPWRGQLQVKSTVVYPLPFWDIRASAVFQNLAGVPILATAWSVPNAQIAPSLGRNLGSCRGQIPCNGTVSISNVIAPNTQFEERLTQLDLRFSKTIPLGRLRVVANFDIYNLFNANTILNRNNTYSSGTTWGTPTDVLAARLFKFGAQISF
jgi:hypothetical protein